MSNSIFESDGRIGRIQLIVSGLKIALLVVPMVYVVSLALVPVILVIPEYLKAPVTLLLLTPVSVFYLTLVVFAIKKRLRDLGHENKHWLWILAYWFVPVVNLFIAFYLFFGAGKHTIIPVTRKSTKLDYRPQTVGRV